MRIEQTEFVAAGKHSSLRRAGELLHTVTPVVAELGFLVFGPRGRVTDDGLMLSLMWPAVYVAYTVAHGAATDGSAARTGDSV